MLLRWIQNYSAAPRRTLGLLGVLAVLIGGAVYVAQQQSEASHTGSVVDIRPSRGGAPLTVSMQFADYLMLPGSSFMIDFGDGTVIDNLPTYNIGSVRYVTAKHTYFRSGIYAPKLSMRRSDGSSNFYYPSSLISVQETQYLDLGLSPQQGRAGMTGTVVFNDYDLFPDTRVAIDFGDGTMDASPATQDIGSVRRWTKEHTYRQAGSYLVTVRAESPSLRVTKYGTKRFFVTNGEALEFTADVDVSNPKLVTVKLSDALIARYCGNNRLAPCEGLRWRFSDGVLINHGAPVYTHTFQNTGPQTITATFADLTLERKLTLGSAPTESFGLTGVTVNGTAVSVNGRYAMTSAQSIQFTGTGSTVGQLVIMTLKPVTGGSLQTKIATISAAKAWQLSFANLRQGTYALEAVVGGTLTPLGTLEVTSPIRLFR